MRRVPEITIPAHSISECGDECHCFNRGGRDNDETWCSAHDDEATTDHEDGSFPFHCPWKTI